MVVQFDQWQFGDENIIIGQKANFKDTISIYSGNWRRARKFANKTSKL